jgi:hypothetical protein
VDGWVKAAGALPAPFVRGDVGMSGPGDEHPADGALNVTDSMRILRKLFLGLDHEFDCAKAADVDDSGSLDLSDAIYLLEWLFLDYAPPPAPFPEAGEDATPDDLGCARYP